MLRVPRCPLCNTPLEPSGQYWVCSRDKFFFNVVNGVPGRPMWMQPGEEAMSEAPQPVKAKEETFEAWIAERGGITPEMYKDLDNKAKGSLKVAYDQRGRKDADVVLYSPC